MAGQAPSPDDIERIRAELEQLIDKGLAEANASGKKLLIVAGELHQSKDSMLVESIALDIAHKRGIENFAVEMPVIDIDTLTTSDITPPLVAPATITTTVAKDVFGMRIIPMDHPLLGKGLDEKLDGEAAGEKVTLAREAHMFHTVGGMGDHVFAVTGIGHLSAFMKSPELQKEFVIVGLDTDNEEYDPRIDRTITAAEPQKMNPGSESFIAKRSIDMLTNPGDHHKITYPGKAQNMDTWDIVRAGFGEENTTELQRGMLASGRLKTREQLVAEVADLTNKLDHTPPEGQEPLYAQRAMASIQLGDYVGAAKDMRASNFYNNANRWAGFSVPENVADDMRAAMIEERDDQKNHSTMNKRELDRLERIGEVPAGAEQNDPKFYYALMGSRDALELMRKEKISYSEMKAMFEANPEIIKAINNYPVREAIQMGYINIRQLSHLNAEETDALIKSDGQVPLDYRKHVEGVIGTDYSPPMPEEKPQQEPQGEQNQPPTPAVPAVPLKP